MMPMDVLERLLSRVVAGPAVEAGLGEVPGRVSREEVFATVALPSFDNSAMDGYAISAEDCGRTGVRLAVTGEVAAGGADGGGLTVAAGKCVRVFTGARVPAGTGAVVMQEDVTAEENGRGIVINEAAELGEFIRRRGADLCEGQRVLARGEVVSPAKTGLLASQGLARVRVGALPRVALLSTGDELTPPGQPLPHPAAIYNSNGPMLAALLREHGLAAPAQSVLRDDLDATREGLAAALEANDVLIISGGVSVGERDWVKPALAALGIAPELWRIALRPGRPFLFATQGEKLIFGLPGNPVSSFVTALLFVLPALRAWQGAVVEAGSAWRLSPAVLAGVVENPGDRMHVMRGALDDGTGVFTPAPVQESHALFALARSNALLMVPPGAAMQAGEAVRVMRY